MKQFYTSSLIIFLSLFFNLTEINAQTLSAGDIAFVGYNTDSGPGPSTDHSFSFITLTDIPGSEVIFFTEEGWNDDTNAWAGTTEGHIEWTAPAAGTPCGTLIYITESGSDVFTITGGGTATLESGLNWNLSGGDQVLAYQAATVEPVTTPTFISGLNGEDGAGTSIDPVTLWNDPSTGPLGPARSGLPFGLTNGVDCVSLFVVALTEQDNAKYTGTLTGASTALRALINDRTNWSFNNTTPFDITPSGYSPSVTCVAPCTDPDIPTATSAPGTICDGNSALLTISGDKNDATAWHVYTGSCGGTLVGTTVGSTIIVTPTPPSTEYFIRGEGGCITPGSCGSITVTTTAREDASFSYAAAAYCVNDIDPTPTITGVGGGTFTSGSGLNLNVTTGKIDISESTPGTYTITYTTDESCPNSSNATIEITQADVTTIINGDIITANAVGATYQWLDCSNGMSVISGETNSSYTATSNGSYAVEVTQNGCTDTSECVMLTTLGISTNLFNNEIIIYPNPASDLIKISGLNEKQNYKIINVLGEVVHTGKISNDQQIDIRNFANGLYFLNFDKGNTIKFIKK